MPTSARVAVNTLVRALNQGDLVDVLQAFTDDAVFSADGGEARGTAELAHLFRGTLEEPRPRMIVRRAQQEGNTLDCRVTRRFTMSDGSQTVSHDVELRCRFTVRDGAVSRLDVDPLEA